MYYGQPFKYDSKPKPTPLCMFTEGEQHDIDFVTLKTAKFDENVKKLLILDLDETLFNSVSGSERPHLQTFLKECFSKYSVAVWSNSFSSYCIPVCKDIFREYFNKLEFVMCCTYPQWVFGVKDPTFLNYPSSTKMCLIDDRIHWDKNQIQIKEFFGDKRDNELIGDIHAKI